MSAKGNFTKEADGTIVYKAVSKAGSAPVELDSSKWYMDKCEIVGYRSEHLLIKINRDGIIRVDGNYKDGKASRSFFNEYIIPDGVDYEKLEFRIYEADQNTLVIVGAIGSHGEMLPATQTGTTTKRTEDVRISSTFTETFESTELEGSEDMSKEIRIVDNKFEAKVNVSEYRSEEVHVKISKKTVLIYTSRKEVTKTSTRNEIKKTFEIPPGVKPESITSVVGEDGNLTVSAKIDEELARKQKQERETISREIVQRNQQVQQTATNEVLIRIRTVNTTKNVTGQDLKDVKINKDRFEMNVDVREYELQEVTVKINKTRRVITISANHKSQFESRSTYREFTLPVGTPDSNPQAIDAVLTPNGILTITGPCTPQTSQLTALTDISDEIAKAVVKQQQENTAVQRQQQNTSVQQQQQNTSVQNVQDTSVEQFVSQQQTVQKSSYTKITRETFSSSTMTSLDVIEADGDAGEPMPSQPDTPIEDITQDMAEDEEGNFIIELDMKDFRAEDITVKASKTTITIIGRKNDEEICKKIHVPVGVVVTPDTIRSILDKSNSVLTIIITRKKTVTTTTTKQVIDDTTEEQNNEQKRIDAIQQQKKQTVQETQTKVQNQQQINQQKQVKQKQESVEEETVEETQTKIRNQQQIEQQKQVQQKQKLIEETQIETQQRINQQKQVQQLQETQKQIQTQQQINQQKQQSIEETLNDNKQQINQQKQIQQKQDSIQLQQDQRQQNNSTTTTTSKRTIKTTTTTVESLQKLGYNFESATKQAYTGDPKFFERATAVIDYKPEELEIKIAMPWIIIEGKQEMTAENGWRSKQFTKMFTVPEGVKQENVHLELNDAGDVVNCTARIG